MEKNRKRAIRRQHNARMLKRAYAMIDSWYLSNEDKIKEEGLHHKWARQFRDNMCVCSCASCGNPRRGYMNGRKERLTLQELKADDDFFDQINEFMTLDPSNDQE